MKREEFRLHPAEKNTLRVRQIRLFDKGTVLQEAKQAPKIPQAGRNLYQC
jgi:hypothetical protein